MCGYAFCLIGKLVALFVRHFCCQTMNFKEIVTNTFLLILNLFLQKVMKKSEKIHNGNNFKLNMVLRVHIYKSFVLANN